MTDATATPTAAPPRPSGPVGQGKGPSAHHGPTDKYYVRIAVALAVITAIEVAWSYVPWADGLVLVEVGGLLLMMAVKFVVVASNFMHLKFDDKVLTRVFYAGLILAISVYVAALTTFELWGQSPGFN